MQNSGSTAPAPTALFPETRHCRALFRTGCRRCLFAFPWPGGSKGEQAQMELKLTGIRKHFGEKEVLRGCGFTFQQGKIYGLLGRNGAGKTTLFNCLTDEVPPDGGTAELVDYMYEHLDEFRLLLDASYGKRFHNFVDELVRIEVEYTYKYMEAVGYAAKSPIRALSTRYAPTLRTTTTG